MMNLKLNFKILVLSLGLFLAVNLAQAQSSLTIDASQAYTNFEFTDSEGVEDDSYEGSFSGYYSIGYQYSNKILLRGNVGMRKAGATKMVDNTNISWDLQYADVKIGIGYIYGEAKFRPYLLVSPYYAFLLTANQTIGDNSNIKELEAIEDNDYGVFVSPGVQFTMNENISAYSQINYMKGLQNLEADAANQELHNTAYSITLGLSFSIQ